MFSKLRGWIMSRARCDAAKEIEILVPPRHQLALLPRRTPRPRMDWTHRLLIAASPDCYRYVNATACSSHQPRSRADTANSSPASGQQSRPPRTTRHPRLRVLVVRLAIENSTSAGSDPLSG
jgi:hypothetical protein